MDRKECPQGDSKIEKVLQEVRHKGILAFDLTELWNMAIILNTCVHKLFVILFLRELNLAQ